MESADLGKLDVDSYGTVEERKRAETSCDAGGGTEDKNESTGRIRLQVYGEKHAEKKGRRWEKNHKWKD